MTTPFKTLIIAIFSLIYFSSATARKPIQIKDFLFFTKDISNILQSKETQLGLHDNPVSNPKNDT